MPLARLPLAEPAYAVRGAYHLLPLASARFTVLPRILVGPGRWVNVSMREIKMPIVVYTTV